MRKLLPHEDSRDPVPIAGGSERVFRVTTRDVDEYTTLRMADTPEDAIDEQKSQLIRQLKRERVREVVECVDYVAQGTTWRSLPETDAK